MLIHGALLANDNNIHLNFFFLTSFQTDKHMLTFKYKEVSLFNIKLLFMLFPIVDFQQFSTTFSQKLFSMKMIIGFHWVNLISELLCLH